MVLHKHHSIKEWKTLRTRASLIRLWILMQTQGRSCLMRITLWIKKNNQYTATTLLEWVNNKHITSQIYFQTMRYQALKTHQLKITPLKIVSLSVVLPQTLLEFQKVPKIKTNLLSSIDLDIKLQISSSHHKWQLTNSISKNCHTWRNQWQPI